MTKIIAEIASSHNGNIELAKAMIKTAAQCGVDIVKFQSWQAKNVSPSDPDKKRYEGLELSDEAHIILIDECKKYGVEFMTSIFDKHRVPFLKKIGVKRVKVASFDLKSTELIDALKGNFEEIIISTGQSYSQEVENVAKSLEGLNYTLLHCVSIYPCPIEKANLNRMNWLKKITANVGYSDHVLGPEAAMLAIGMGAKYVEKHFTLDRNMEQVPHTASAKEDAKPTTTHQMADEPPTFRIVCDFNKKAKILLGDGSSEPDPDELFHRSKYTGRLDGSWKK